MDIAVLGPLAVDGRSASWGRRDRVVLAALAARTGRAVSADQLADALWHDGPPVSADKVVQGCVSRLRRELGREAIETVPGGYRLVAAIDAVDAARFERMVARARELLSLGEADRAGYLLGEALALWRGPALAELEDWEPGMVEAARWEELRLEAEELRVDAYVQAGRFDEVLAQAETMVRAAPLRERRWGLLASAQYQAGRQGEALRTIARARAMLVDGLGIDPGPELGALEQAILRQDVSLLVTWAARSNRDARCPYRGLSAYGVADAEEFFGRDADLQTCWGILEDKNVLAVVGPSGFGKSSLVRAGIAARMVDEGRRVRVMTPGPRPSEELDAALDGPPTHLLVVDQAEELFSLSEDDESLSHFVERLIDIAQHTKVVLALRADRLADVATRPGLARLVEQGLHLLGPLDETGLREVIESPARQQGLILEPGLVDLLVREVEDEPGALPLLSYALAQTWRRREANTLTVAGYQATGGIKGAVTKTAESLYMQVDPAERHVLRDVLLRLVAPGPDAQPVRTRLPRRLIAAEPTQDHLVDLLIAARLVTSAEGQVEIAHESLTRAWPRLRGWLDDDVEGQRIRHHLIGAADAWDSMGRPASELYRGTRLAQAQDWRRAAHRELSANERAFLDTAAQAAHDEQAALADHAQAQTRMVRRLRGLLAAGAVLLAASLVAGSLAVRQTGIADRAAQSARAAGLTAEAGRLGARALTLNDPSTSLLLAAEAVQLEDNLESRSYLRAALQRHRGLVASTAPVPQAWGFALDPSGTTFAVAGLDNEVRLIDADTGTQLASSPIRGQEDYLGLWTQSPIGFSSLKGAIAIATPGYIRSPVQLLHADSLEPLPQQLKYQPKHARAWSLDFSADGRYLAVVYVITEGDPNDDGRVVASDLRVWDLAAPEARPWRIRLERQKYYDSVQISDDGRVAYVSGPLRAFSVRSGALLWKAAESGYSRISLSPDGRFLAFPPSTSAGLVVVDTRTGREVGRLAENDAGMRGWPAIWSDDSSRLAALVGDEVRVWRWPSMKQERAYPTADVFDLAFGRDGSQLHIGAGGAIQTWDLAGADPLMPRQEAEWTGDPQMMWIEPSPDGRFLAGITDGEWNALMLDTLTMKPVALGGPPPKDVVTVPTWSPDSSTAVVGLPGGDVAVMHTDGSWERRHVSEGGLLGLEYSRDGTRLLVADKSGIWLSDANTLRRDTPIRTVDGLWEGRLMADGHSVFALTVSPKSPHGEPDGWRVVDLDSGAVSRGSLPEAEPVTWGNVAVAPIDPPRVAIAHDRGALLINLSTGRIASAPVAAHGAPTYTVSFSSDGSRFVTATGEGDGSIALWDGHTGDLLDTMDTESGEASYAFVQEDGTVLIATSGSLSVWDPSIDTAIQVACRMAGRSLTQREWSQHVGDRAFHETCPAA